ncbi:MAG: hypothetical protein A3C90_03815 [Candidatus Magasanikbacteria bacterium RIFCSPHIGHO2_02_FULL_51_14]|uniref:Uncharacterized protein n=1 Tax=Candidatus Magasanikbacteria bacterium RIFCSPHIGHO2_02_FULL_51_14 TaxID=1798683 RepID=A0A1F6MP46_9BACT|nr:MAG: hypothetical protein A3C90_03815 [Candidatus Magasanikbacteria bacterium RIFCSPHIGHO2_02_FULL_51_14]
MDERNLENQKRQREQAFLTFTPFIRSCEVMETYQNLLVEHKDNSEMVGAMKKRWHDIFDVRKKETGESGSQSDYGGFAAELERIAKQMNDWCESGEFTREKLAALFAGSVIGDKLLARWSPKAGSRRPDGTFVINEVLEYKTSGTEDAEIGLNIFPTQVKGTAQLLGKVYEGLQKVAQEMQSGSLQHVKKVVMISWLFGPSFGDKVKQIFGDDIMLEDVPDESAFEVQKLALSYNSRATAEYLTTGQLPPVRSLTMDNEEFVRKFGGA